MPAASTGVRKSEIVGGVICKHLMSESDALQNTAPTIRLLVKL